MLHAAVKADIPKLVMIMAQNRRQITVSLREPNTTKTVKPPRKFAKGWALPIRQTTPVRRTKSLTPIVRKTEAIFPAA